MTPRQFYIILFIFVITTKMQRLPCLLFEEFGKDGYLIILLYYIIDLLAIILAFFIARHINRDKFNDSKNVFFTFIKKLTMFATTIFFIIEALLLYEHIQDLFANTLFDNLSWPIFSLLLIFTVFYLAKSGIKNIAFNFEVYVFIIILPLIFLSILGATHSTYSFILPFETINFNNLLVGASKFNIWFGDFFIIFYMLFHTKKAKMSKTILFYSLSMAFVLFLTITFEGIYQYYTPLQTGMISTISEQSMLGINIGRVDWFLILFSEIGTILSCAVCIYFANKTLNSTFPKSNPLFLNICIAIVFYIIDIIILKDKFAKRVFFFGIGGDLSIILKIFTIALLLTISLKDIYNSKKKNINLEMGV